MTQQEMIDSFEKYKRKLIQYVKRRYHITQDEEDIVMEAFVGAFGGKEYEKVPLGRARTWWYYKVRGKATAAVTKSADATKGLLRYQNDPTVTNQWHEDLSDIEGAEVLQEYWEGLPRYAKTRIRQQWTEECKAWLPFMYPQE